MWPHEIGNWAEVFTAVGTVGAVIVALFADVIKARIAHARLDMRLKPGNVHVDVAKDGSQDNPERRTVASRWFHLRVENRKRLFPAKAVSVFVLQIEQRRDGLWHSIWAGEASLFWRYSNDVFRDMGEADCDLLYFIQGGPLKLRKAPWTGIDTFEPPVDLRLTLRAQAADARSRPVYVVVKWNGEWPANWEDLDANVLEIREVSPTPRKKSWLPRLVWEPR